MSEHVTRLLQFNMWVAAQMPQAGFRDPFWPQTLPESAIQSAV
jgi:hypothetical protein